jgi:hypothetical protein
MWLIEGKQMLWRTISTNRLGRKRQRIANKSNNTPLPTTSIQSFHGGSYTRRVLMLHSEMRQRTAAATRRRGIVDPATFMCLSAQRQPAREFGVVPSSTRVAKQFDGNFSITHDNVAIATSLPTTHFTQNNHCVQVLRQFLSNEGAGE